MANEWQPTPCPVCLGFCGDQGPTCAELAAPTPRLVPDRPSDALLPCPFCTRPRPVIACREELGGPRYEYVFCPDCGARGPDHMLQAEAIKAWNTRPNAAAPPAEAPAERGDLWASLNWWRQRIPQASREAGELLRTLLNEIEPEIRALVAAAEPDMPQDVEEALDTLETLESDIDGFADCTNTVRRHIAQLAAAPAAPATTPRVTGGREAEWRELYRIQTAMRYMDNGMEKEAAYRNAEQDVAALQAANGGADHG